MSNQRVMDVDSLNAIQMVFDKKWDRLLRTWGEERAIFMRDFTLANNITDPRYDHRLPNWAINILINSILPYKMRLQIILQHNFILCCRDGIFNPKDKYKFLVINDKMGIEKIKEIARYIKSKFVRVGV